MLRNWHLPLGVDVMTAFRSEIPATTAQPYQVVPCCPVERTMLVLLVEDDFLIAMAMQDALEAVGYEVVGPAATVAEALRLVETRRPDLALVDITLRGGDSGVDLCRALRRRDVPCLFVSGEPTRARAARDIALGYLAKPCREQTIIESVECVDRLLHGIRPDCLPHGLELFALA